MQSNSFNNNNINMDPTFNNSYLKSSKEDLPALQLDQTSHSRPRVIQWDPYMGTEHSTITVVLEQAVSDTSIEEIHPMKIVFGRLVVETNQQQQRAPTASPNQLHSQLAWITLVAHVPKLSDTQVDTQDRVPLSICIYDRHTDTAIDHWEFGIFTYNKGLSGDKRGEKREAVMSDHYPIKRLNTSLEDDPIFHQLLAPFDDTTEKPKLNSKSIDPRLSQYNTMLNQASSALSKAAQAYPSLQIQSAPLFEYPDFSSSYNYPTTSMFHAPPPNLMMPLMNEASISHPFAGVLNKANLKIVGDLSSMTEHWTPEEWSRGRRLVQFWRKQLDGDQVECGFEAVAQDAYQRLKDKPLVISCIYWQQQREYVVTSVDCIYLLEGLIGVQFTVEEKNRIRRNLEGFKPRTVSKCKPECEAFFKLIMGFPHPKPRNIEKDVKVFSWTVLASALKKIIRKYTPSYSSTAVVHV